MGIFLEEQPIDLKIKERNDYPTIRDALGRTGIKVRHRSIQSDNYSPATAGWIIRANGTIEALSIIAGDYITTFVQTATPTSLHIGDLWIKTNDNNSVYRAASVGADQIAVGEWIKYGTVANWSEVVDDDSNKPDDNATEGAKAGTNLKESGGSVATQLAGLFTDLGSINAGDITLDSSGFIKGGQTAYNTGTGFWLGYSSGYKFSIGSPTGNRITWDGSALNIVGKISHSAGDVLYKSADTERGHGTGSPPGRGGRCRRSACPFRPSRPRSPRRGTSGGRRPPPSA